MILSFLLSQAFAVRPEVVVVVSDDLEPYEAPLPAFSDAVGVPIHVIRIHGRQVEADKEMAELRVNSPKVVFALGAKAAFAVKNELPHTPLIYASVADPKRYGIEGTQVTGIKASVPPVSYLSRAQAFFPLVSSVGVIRSSSVSDDEVRELEQAGQDVGIKVTVRRVENPRKFRKAFNELAETQDAIWIAPERDILTPEGFRAATNEMQRRRKPLLVNTDNMVTAGGALGITPNPDGVGRQAAEKAKRILDGAAPSILPISDPEDLATAINLRTIEQGEIAYETLMLDLASRVVEP